MSFILIFAKEIILNLNRFAPKARSAPSEGACRLETKLIRFSNTEQVPKNIFHDLFSRSI